MSDMFAIAIPVIPEKMEQFNSFIADLNGSRKSEFKASRDRLGVRERTFLQHTPMGVFVVVTLEGNDPASAFANFASGTDEFTQWFISNVHDIHGIDISQPPPGPLPHLIADSHA